MSPDPAVPGWRCTAWGLGLRGVSRKNDPNRRAPGRCDIIIRETGPMREAQGRRRASGTARAISPTAAGSFWFGSRATGWPWPAGSTGGRRRRRASSARA